MLVEDLNGRDGSAVWDQRLGSVGYDPNIPKFYVGYNPLGEITYPFSDDDWGV